MKNLKKNYAHFALQPITTGKYMWRLSENTAGRVSQKWHAVLSDTLWVLVHEYSEGRGRINTDHISMIFTTEAQKDNCEGRINKLPYVNNGNCLFVGKTGGRICFQLGISVISSCSVFFPTLNWHNYCHIFLCLLFSCCDHSLELFGSFFQCIRSFFTRAFVTSWDLL